MISAGCLHGNRGNGKRRLDPRVLEYTSLNGEEGVRVGNVDLGEAVVEWPEVRDGLATVHHDYKRAFAADEVNEELEEGIDCESLRETSQLGCAVENNASCSGLLILTNLVYIAKG